MKYILTAVFVTACIIAAYFLLARQSEPLDAANSLPKNVSIVLTKNGFVPSEVRIPLDGSVTFSTDRDKPFWPASNSHPSHNIYPEFDPRHPVDSADTWTYVFDRAGDWRFHDHLRSYFTGIIHVVQ